MDFNYIFVNILQILAFLGALVFAYLAAFSYEDEEGEIQDKLAGWWVRLDDAQKKTQKKLVLFIQFLTRSNSNILDTFFGSKILSFASISVSMFLSIGSAYSVILVASIGLLLVNFSGGGLFAILFMILIWIGLYRLATSQVRTEIPPVRAMFYTVGILLAPGISMWVGSIFSQDSALMIVWVIAIVPLMFSLFIAVFTDVICIAVTRFVFRVAEKSQSLLFSLSCLFGNSIFILLLAAGLPLIFILNDRFYAWTFGGYSRNITLDEQFLGISALLVLASNLPSLVSSVYFVVASIVLLMGRFVGATLARLVYSGHRFKLVKNKKLMWSLCGTLLTASGFEMFQKFYSMLNNVLPFSN